MLNFSFIFMAGVMMYASATQPSSRQVEADWDFSKTRHIDAVPWPKEDGQPRGILHHVEVNRDIVVRIDADNVFQRYVRMVTFARFDDRLAYMSLELENQPAEAAVKTVTFIATQWKLPLERLDLWKKDVASGRTSTALLMNNQRTPALSLEIFRTFEDNAPYRIVCTLDWLHEHIGPGQGKRDTPVDGKVGTENSQNDVIVPR
jgi:hypothetical protein